jgi:CobQ-like glutamine amidotransferase family enzyme
MKEIKLLHLFPKLLSLYGEYGNVKIIEKSLKDKGYEANITEYEGLVEENVDFSEFDFVYVGSGTEKNLIEASKRLLPHKDALCALISSGKCVLATGNAMTLFGKTLKLGANEYETIGAFSYTSEIFTNKRFQGDVLTDDNNIFSSRLIGFINTSAIYQGIETPLTNNLLGAKLGNDKASSADGFISGSFIGTQLIGPIAVKNPNVLAKICEMITGEGFDIDTRSSRFLAYSSGLRALEERLLK